jgi:hypothetical protein
VIHEYIQGDRDKDCAKHNPQDPPCIYHGYEAPVLQEPHDRGSKKYQTEKRHCPLGNMDRGLLCSLRRCGLRRKETLNVANHSLNGMANYAYYFGKDVLHLILLVVLSGMGRR